MILQIIVGIHFPLLLPQVYCSHSLLFCDICFPRSIKTGCSVKIEYQVWRDCPGIAGPVVTPTGRRLLNVLRSKWIQSCCRVAKPLCILDSSSVFLKGWSAKWWVWENCFRDLLLSRVKGNWQPETKLKNVSCISADRNNFGKSQEAKSLIVILRMKYKGFETD